MATKRTTKIVSALNNLNKHDVYSLLLFTLYKMKDDPKYSTLSELCYILDGDNLTKFLSYYGGMTISVPTLKEIRALTQTLLLYQYVNIEGGNFKDALITVCGDEFSQEEIKDNYNELLSVISEFDFERKQI